VEKLVEYLFAGGTLSGIPKYKIIAKKIGSFLGAEAQ
jgi:hypothetical protein